MEATTVHRHTGQVAALVAAPVLGLATTLVWPETPEDPAERLLVLAEAGIRMDIAHLLNLLTILAFVPAIVGMLRLLDGRKPRFRAVGAVLATLGVLGWTGTLALGVVEVQAARLEDPGAGLPLLEAIGSSLLGVLFLLMFLVCLYAGLIVLAVGMWRAKRVPGWVPVAVGLAVAVDITASMFTVAVIVVWLLQCAAWGRTAIALARSFRVRELV